MDVKSHVTVATRQPQHDEYCVFTTRETRRVRAVARQSLNALSMLYSGELLKELYAHTYTVTVTVLSYTHINYSRGLDGSEY